MAVAGLDAFAVIVTAAADPGQGYDFVSRVFAPKAGLDEDPVTGAAHTVLAPYWVDRLGRAWLTGFQASARSGIVGVAVNGERVIVTGHAVIILDGILSPTAMPN
jgi:predicted PhzF superfamily epimerase YddE/YHI9